jgi:hypothetical protein
MLGMALLHNLTHAERGAASLVDLHRRSFTGQLLGSAANLSWAGATICQQLVPLDASRPNWDLTRSRHMAKVRNTTKLSWADATTCQCPMLLHASRSNTVPPDQRVISGAPPMSDKRHEVTATEVAFHTPARSHRNDDTVGSPRS